MFSAYQFNLQSMRMSFFSYAARLLPVNTVDAALEHVPTETGLIGDDGGDDATTDVRFLLFVPDILIKFFFK
jgi:hypothetical protein